MAKRKSKSKGQTVAQAKKRLRDGECTTVVVKGKERSLCKVGGKVRLGSAPT